MDIREVLVGIIATSVLAQAAPFISALLGGGLIGAIATFRRVTAERESISMTASRTAVEVFQASIDQLREDLDAAQEEIMKLTKDLILAHKELSAVMVRKAELEVEVSLLRRRVVALESKVDERE